MVYKQSVPGSLDMAASPRMLLLSVSLLQFSIQCVQANYHCAAQYNRYPDNRDISIDCGAHLINLSINLCPPLFAGFDPLTLALNGRYNDTKCKGRADVSATPPVIRYSVIVNDVDFNNCGNHFKILDEAPGAGTFAQFSNLQSVVISGFIDPPNDHTVMISYNPRLYYKFSCKYPLEYILNNTRLITSSISIAVATSNGSFSSTLTLQLYDDQDYTSPLIVPDSGLPLRYKVYVEVSISNLTANFNVLLDHCFATPSPFNLSLLDTGYIFFTGCNISPRTTILRNGISKKSRFVFDTFRFNEHRDRKLSTIYVHCITRLCETKTCQTLLQGCYGNGRKRRKREIFTDQRVTTQTFTVSSGPIYIREEDYLTSGTPAPLNGVTQSTKNHHMTLVGPIVGIVLAIAAGLTMIAIIRMWRRNQLSKRKQPEQDCNNVDYSSRIPTSPWPMFSPKSLATFHSDL
ncbi:zona pellucida-like domain-containing protein 1 [Pristis pectinata]|uniref:zona pellucida-like domain-containing protein 1 n=1 Tax=Pristis pectinata TaxID=685728 RepID=UPI00223CEA41|nr:zona pellucida-like domain-containing protein 1 [Pristis pectinata]